MLELMEPPKKSRVAFDTDDLYHRTFIIAAARRGGSLRKLFEDFADRELQREKRDAAEILGYDQPDEAKPKGRKPKD